MNIIGTFFQKKDTLFTFQKRAGETSPYPTTPHLPEDCGPAETICQLWLLEIILIKRYFLATIFEKIPNYFSLHFCSLDTE